MNKYIWLHDTVFEKAERVANIADPDHMPHSAMSDLGLTVCSGQSVKILRVNMVAVCYVPTVSPK